MNLTRADIRRTLLRSGRYDLNDPDDVRRLDRYVEGFERWVRSEAANLLGGEALHKNPRELLEGVKWGNANKAKKNEKDVISYIRRRNPVKLIGPPALRVALAFAKQACIQWGWMPLHMMASNLITDDLESLSRGPRSVLILETWPDAEHGKIFAEVEAKIISLLRGHRGATILVSERAEPGVLDRACTSILRPRLSLRVSGS